MASRRLTFFSTVATKILIALTGLSLVGFLCVHLMGNLLLYAGPAKFNGYAHALISNPLIKGAEVGLVALFLIHAFEAVMMWISNRSARPISYVNKRPAGGRSRKSAASTTMILTGPIVGIFLVVHVLTMKYGTWYPAPGVEPRDLYRLVAETFAQPAWAGLYAVCMVVVGLHLWHGFSSGFESLGLNHPAYTPKVIVVGRILALALGAGFFSIPIWMFVMSVMGGRS
jgi:succinate dehydrogenase / fumarate reductase, cytochrome b subunit